MNATGSVASEGAPARVGSSTHQRALTLLAIAALVTCGALPLLVSEGIWLYVWINGYFVFASLAAAIKCFHTATRLGGNERTAWLSFGAGCLSYGLGCLVWGIYEVSGVYNPTPSAADIGMLSTSAFFIAGLWFYRTRATSMGVTLVLLGNLGIILAAILIANLILYYDAFHQANDPRVAAAFVAYDVLDTAALLFGLISISLYTWGRRRLIMAVILMGIFMLAFANIISAHGVLRVEYSSIDPINGLYLACFGFIYWAAFEQDQLGHIDEDEILAAESEARAKQWETLIPPIAVAVVLVVALAFREGLSLALLPFVAGVAVLFIASLAMRDWWSHRNEADLRAQALIGESRLQESERRLREKNEELSGANRELLEEMKRRMRVEEELRHSQKLEALGQLTGGVAHDFNNLLAVIQGNLELLEKELHAKSGLRELAFEASAAAERGADLTQRLLAFSSKQQLQPSAVEAGALLQNMRSLLERTLGEMIQIAIAAPANLWPCLADPAQLENAVLNLAINARDAMPDGGELVLGATNVALGTDHSLSDPAVQPGDYVRVSVRDTGAGMSAEVQSRVFEPFFTTKEVGAGSGLGLSMVYGFVRQSEGCVEIRSEKGEGAEIALYLPRAVQRFAPAEAAIEAEIPEGRGESVLVVEDEAAVRKLIVTLLEDLGYVVSEARDGPSALAVLDDLVPLQLILSDVVLPGGMSGRNLAREVRSRRPGVEVALMSGYAADAPPQKCSGNGDAVLLRKPFKKAELARKIRTLLDAPR